MSKTIEKNILTVTIKRFLREFSLYWTFICTDENNDKNKTNLPSPFFHPSKIFINRSKTAESMSLQFSKFLFVFIKRI